MIFGRVSMHNFVEPPKQNHKSESPVFELGFIMMKWRKFVFVNIMDKVMKSNIGCLLLGCVSAEWVSKSLHPKLKINVRGLCLIPSPRGK